MAALLGRLRRRPDSEHEQAMVRVVLVLILLGYFWATLDGPAGLGLAVILLYPAVSFVYVAWIVAAPGANPPRRILAMLSDFLAMSLLMIDFGETAAPMYPLFLWVTLGNGFRYGLPYLVASTAVGALSFAIVIAIAVPWRDHLGLSLGLLGGLVVVPAYASTLIRKLTEAKVQAEAANRAKSRFLAVISHELRTPLNAVIGMAELLDSTKLDPRQREMSHTIRLSGQALLSLIDSVLDFSRIEARRTEVTVATVDLDRSLADLLLVLGQQAEAKNLRLGVGLAADVPPLIRADWPHIRQILTNLISNAIKFTERGGIRIEVSCGASGGRRMVVFDVVDTGIGIPADKLEYVFKSFAQADDDINRRYGGTGLGLTISRHLAELLGGGLQAESRIGEGSRFRLQVPLEEVPDEAAAAAPGMEVVLLAADAVAEAFAAAGVEFRRAASAAEAVGLVQASAAPTALCLEQDALALRSAAGLGVPLIALGSADADGQPLLRLPSRPTPAQVRRAVRACAIFHGDREPEAARDVPLMPPLRILLAEDNATNRRVMGLLLERGGHRYDVVATGDELLDAIENGTFDVVVTDINMPGLNVIEAVKLYRMAHLGEQGRLPIIACTADATPQTRRACDEAGFDAFLTKPVIAATLLATIAELVRPSRAAGGQATGKVADLTAHPGFSGPSSSPVDWHTVDGLLELGDDDLLRELVEEFAADALGLLDSMAAAGAAGDASRFRAECHALKSSAANVGARAVARLCQSGGAVEPGALAVEYKDFCLRAKVALNEYTDEIARRLGTRESSASS